METIPKVMTREVNDMDALLKSIKTERFNASDEIPVFVGCANFNPSDHKDKIAFPMPLVSDICGSPRIALCSAAEQAKVKDIAFRYLMQLELFDASVELGDKPVQQFETEPTIRNQVIAATSLQHQIICARIVLECFFDLLRACDNGERFKGNKKFRSYKKWMLSENTEYRKFIPLIMAGFRFDRIYRTPEVHGTSKLPYAILEKNLQSSALFKVRFALTNALRMSWTTLIDTLYDREGGAWTTIADSDVLEAYYQLDEDQLESFLTRVFDERMS